MEVANIYDNGPIAPIAKIRDNLRIWTEKQWLFYKIINMEPIPRSSPFMVDFVATTVPAATVVAAGGTIQMQLVAALLMNDLELLHLRWEPIDDMEGLLWELGGQGRFMPRGGHARVSLYTSISDPYLATTTFFIVGANKDAMIEVRNPDPVARPNARFVFWGYRYSLEKLTTEPAVYTDLPAQGF